MATKAKKRKRRSPASAKKKGGVMMGMRSGFKNVAGSVGVGEAPQRKKKSNLVGTIITVALVLVAAVVLYKRFL